MGHSITVPVNSTSRQSANITGSFTSRTTREVQVIIANSANTVTFTFDIYDSNSYPRYSISGLAKNANHLILVERVVRPNWTYGITANANCAANVAVTINPEYYPASEVR